MTDQSWLQKRKDAIDQWLSYRSRRIEVGVGLGILCVAVVVSISIMTARLEILIPVVIGTMMIVILAGFYRWWVADRGKKKPSVRSNPSDDTRLKIEHLLRHRKEYLKKHGTAPTFSKATQLVGIDPKTVKKHAKELVVHWNDKNYQG